MGRCTKLRYSEVTTCSQHHTASRKATIADDKGGSWELKREHRRAEEPYFVDVVAFLHVELGVEDDLATRGVADQPHRAVVVLAADPVIPAVSSRSLLSSSSKVLLSLSRV